MHDDNTPDPPEPTSPWQYASWGPEPTNIHVTVSTEKPEEARWDFSWLGLRDNSWTAVLAFVPGTIWARVLHDVHEQQSLAGAGVMGGVSVLVTAIRFGQRRTWTRRTMLWIALIGCVLSLPVFTELVRVMTGGGR